jgi:hypothetical protein
MATVSAQPPASHPTSFSAALSSPPSLNPQSITPPDSDPTTPNDHSPSSPRSNWAGSSQLQLQPKQIRTPRAPMYVPAVLRPTEKFMKASPPKKGQAADVNTPLHAPSGILSLDYASASIRPNLRRMVTEEWTKITMGQVTGPPSRNHWKVSGINCK